MDRRIMFKTQEHPEERRLLGDHEHTQQNMAQGKLERA